MLGRLEEAPNWAVNAASRPNAHPHILAIAAFSLALSGSLDEARKWATALRRAHPGYGIADFLGAFRFDPHGAALFRKGAKRLEGRGPLARRACEGRPACRRWGRRI